MSVNRTVNTAQVKSKMNHPRSLSAWVICGSVCSGRKAATDHAMNGRISRKIAIGMSTSDV